LFSASIEAIHRLAKVSLEKVPVMAGNDFLLTWT
jgi:hypothetical protein